LRTAFALALQAPGLLFEGYLCMYILHRFLVAYVCDKPHTSDHVIGLLPLLGIGYYFLKDGEIFSPTCSVNFFAGIVAAVG